MNKTNKAALIVFCAAFAVVVAFNLFRIVAIYHHA